MQGESRSRFLVIDVLRGTAVFLMIFFHFFYDLSMFRYVEIDFSRDFFWWGLPRLIVFLFLLAVGLSSPLTHFPEIQWKKVQKRFLKIALSALLISIVTYILFPSAWIYFGTLHCIALVDLFILPLIHYPLLALIIFLGLVIPSVFLNWNIPWFHLTHQSMDYIPLFPWVGFSCLGIFLFHKNFHKFSLPNLMLLRFLQFLGKHAFPIYLTHQIVMYGLIWIFYQKWP